MNSSYMITMSRQLFPQTTVLFLLLFVVPQIALSQWSVAGSFQLQDEDPSDGFGIHVEREFLKPLPILDIRLRAHGSRMGEDVDIDQGGNSLTQNITTWDFGLAGVAGVSSGVLRLYSGFGGGYMSIESEAENIDLSDPEFFDVIGEVDDSSFFWNIIAGFEFTPVPVVNPFFEYRYISISDDDNFGFSSINRLSVGFTFDF